MRLYLGPEPSLELIRYLRSVNGAEGIEGTVVRKRLLRDAINTARQVKELDATAHFWLEHVTKPIRAFVPDRVKGTTTKLLATQLFSQEVPYGTFLNLGHGICICTPAFAFVQLAASKSIVELIDIGMELCGTYSRWSLPPASATGSYRPDYEGSRACTYDVPPAMNANRLEAFLERMRGQRGAVGARAAARWLVNGSASPMETATYLLLCLPKRLGGYGLPQPTLNPRLIIHSPDGTKERYPDLFWLGRNIDIEYNSDAEHSGEWARYRDSKREVELVVANVRVLPLTRPQLMDREEFDAFANGLRRMLGIRTRTPHPDWEFKRDELHRKLLAPWADEK